MKAPGASVADPGEPRLTGQRVAGAGVEGSGSAIAAEARRGVVERFRGASVGRRGDGLRLEAGSYDDYRRLAAFHYKSARPGAVTSVFRLVHRAPTVVGRYLGRGNETEIVGVLVRSLPHLSCRLRDLATRGRYRGLSRRDSAAMLNGELRTISRVVIDPRWRGLGLAVRLVRHVLEHGETIFTEALAAMGRVHPFFERAGMTRYDRPALAHEARLADALHRMELHPSALASSELVAQRLSASDEATRQWFESELRRWHQAGFRARPSAVHRLQVSELLRSARDRLLCRPVYYLFDHRSAAAISHDEGT